MTQELRKLEELMPDEDAMKAAEAKARRKKIVRTLFMERQEYGFEEKEGFERTKWVASAPLLERFAIKHGATKSIYGDQKFYMGKLNFNYLEIQLNMVAKLI